MLSRNGYTEGGPLSIEDPPVLVDLRERVDRQHRARRERLADPREVAFVGADGLPRVHRFRDAHAASLARTRLAV